MRRIVKADEFEQFLQENEKNRKRDIIFSGIVFENYESRSNHFEDCIFINCVFSNANLTFWYFENCQFYGLRIKHCCFHRLDLMGCEFKQTIIRDTEFQDCRFLGVRSDHESQIMRCTFTDGHYGNCQIAAQGMDTNRLSNFVDLEQRVSPNTINVGVVGMPMVGKRTLLQCLKEYFGASEMQLQEVGEDYYRGYLLSLDLQMGGKQWRFTTLPGCNLAAYFHFRSILAQSDIVICIASMRYPDDHLIFHEVIPHAKALNKSWEDVPWLLLLNKIDCVPADYVLQRPADWPVDREHLSDMLEVGIPVLKTSLVTLDQIEAIRDQLLDFATERSL